MSESLNECGGWWRRGLRRVFDLLKETILAWRRDKASRLAAALAYYAIFSITPLLVIIIAITGLVFGERAAQAEIAHQLEDLVGLEAALMIENMLANFGNTASGILTSLVGLVTLLYGASGLFNHVQGTLDTIWHAPPRLGNGVVHFVRQRVLHIAMVFGVGALLMLTLFAELVITAITEYLNLESLPWARNFLVSLVMLTVMFAIIFKILPQVKIAWRDVLIGAAVTSLLFNVGRLLIGAYMRWSNIGSIFGAAGSLAVLLVWVYYSAQIFLLGAEFTHIYALKFGSLRKPPALPLEEKIVSLPEVPPAKNDSAPLPIHSAGEVEPASPSAETKRRIQPKKVLAITTVAGTVVASALGASLWYRKRKEKTES
ncbi:MAG TPA: YihY/virulence factor BrkB family protein [Anaerolineae bacterium]|nr:YihY/virulence factor BrkB family protein [Anaerolineae bacterium]HQI87587.1 YihY/virulence factor BrkB family protein [Anaerolineae bacterium]